MFTRHCFKDHVKYGRLLAAYRRLSSFTKTGVCSCKNMKHLKLLVTKKNKIAVHALFLGLPLSLLPLPLCTLLLTGTLPPLRLFSSVFDSSLHLCPLEPPVRSELANVGLLTSLATSVNSFQWLCGSQDSRSVTVFSFWPLCAPQLHQDEKCVLVSR